MRQLGGKIDSDELKKLELSPNWKDGVFENLEFTKMDVGIWNFPRLLYKQVFDKKGRIPLNKLPIFPLNVKEFDDDKIQYVWFGHSALLLNLKGFKILIDPMLGNNASPIGPIKTERFTDLSVEIIDQLPEIDLLLLSHDHYDHLDLESVLKLQTKVKKIFTALGVARHLIHWGISKDKIHEFDWWDTVNVESISVHFTPSRHFSGRGLRDRFKSLWGGWVLEVEDKKIYFSGDGGYGEHFKEIGRRLGPFDLGFMECGQYNELWHQIHMYPEETVQSAIDAKVNISSIVHWSGFSLSLHPWKEPAQRFTREAERKQLKYNHPLLGKIINIEAQDKNEWWNHFE
jgi:L-ascorbate metabolism protein UlaG (beta-lactamase superfamily)